jgi:hypothetical protein
MATKTVMASKTTLTAKNLEALGAARLAELLLELSAGEALIKRRLRLELAGAASPEDVAREVRKRLATIARARSYVDWDKRRTLVADLKAQRRAILDHVAPSEPAKAADLLWQVLGLAGSVFDRCDDSNGAVMSVFHAAVHDLGAAALAADLDQEGLADRTFAALCENDYGQYDELIAILAPALGAAGLDRLKARVQELAKTPIPRHSGKDRAVIGWASSGPIHADEIAQGGRDIMVRLALEAIADAQGDVDGFIAQKTGKARTVPSVAAEIARRLLDAGRAQEAWKAIEAVPEERGGHFDPDWQDARLAVMEALGKAGEAQAFRWRCFEQGLDARHLRAHLKRLADFDDIEAEERALAFVQASPRFHAALAFLAAWPALDRAAALVLSRAEELDGDLYYILVPAAEALETKFPLAATLIRRALIDFTLGAARTSRYRHAARHLLECQSLAGQIGDFGGFETHENYRARLKSEHGRKSAFWTLLE